MQSPTSAARKYLLSPVGQLGLVAMASLLIYILAFLQPFNLLELYDQTRLDTKSLFSPDWSSNMRLGLAFIGAWSLYLLGYRISLRVGNRRAWAVVLGGMIGFILVFLFMAPFDAADIYDNIMHGRIVGVHRANPFQQVIKDYPEDPFYEYSAWKRVISAYGPLWETLAGLTARLAGDGIIVNVLAFKILPGLFHLAGVGLTILLLKLRASERALSGALLIGWNPMLIYETWGNGHNDVAMAFWFLLTAWWIVRHRYTLAALSLLAGALIKFLPILLVPAVLWIAWHNLESRAAWLGYLARTGTLAAAMAFAAYYPFWNGLASLSIQRRMNLFTTSIPAVAYHLLDPVFGEVGSARLVSLAALAILVCFVLIQTFRSGNTSCDFSTTTFNILVFYLMLTCLWFQQWYSIWLVCLAALLPPQSRNLALVFSFWVVGQQLLFGPFFVPTMYRHPGTVIRLQPLLTGTVLGVPWLYALFTLFRGKKHFATI